MILTPSSRWTFLVPSATSRSTTRVMKRGSYSIADYLTENLSELSDEELLRQIDFITEVFEQEQDTIQLDTSRNIRILPILVEQVQKNRSVEVNVHVVNVGLG